MAGSGEHSNDWIDSRIRRYGQGMSIGSPVIHRDTSDFMRIQRDHVIDLEGRLFLVRGDEHEGRFGLGGEPKFWVKRTIDLDSGGVYILKLVFHEEFTTRLGDFHIKCRRSEDKEARVLELVQGDSRFMQGGTAVDSRDNLVRVIEFIHGPSLLGYLVDMSMGHEDYYEKVFPDVLAHSLECLRGIARLHEANLCHGDIRNDHIIVETETGSFRWIDFDLTQDFSDLDLWSIGNILHGIVGKGFVTFRDVAHRRPDLAEKLVDEDASAILTHRIMNLRKVYPYIPEKLNDILLRFSLGTQSPYDSVDQILDDLGDFATSMGGGP